MPYLRVFSIAPVAIGYIRMACLQQFVLKVVCADIFDIKSAQHETRNHVFNGFITVFAKPYDLGICGTLNTRFFLFA